MATTNPEHISRAHQAVLAVSKVLWPTTDDINRHPIPETSPILRKHAPRIALPLRGVVPHFLPQDISESYGPKQQASLDAWADTYVGTYWLVARRRLEFERPADVFGGDGPDWAELQRVYVDRLHYYSSMRWSGMTVPTLMRLLDRLRVRGGAAGIDSLAASQVRLGMEPSFSKNKQIRCERIGSILVAGHPRPDVRDYDIGGAVVPQIGRRAIERSQPIKEI